LWTSPSKRPHRKPSGYQYSTCSSFCSAELRMWEKNSHRIMLNYRNIRLPSKTTPDTETLRSSGHRYHTIDVSGVWEAFTTNGWPDAGTLHTGSTQHKRVKARPKPRRRLEYRIALSDLPLHKVTRTSSRIRLNITYVMTILLSSWCANSVNAEEAIKPYPNITYPGDTECESNRIAPKLEK